MTNFGLTDRYYVHNSLNQREVFSPLLWCIFYDPLLCEVKRQESVCKYKLNSYFISKNSCSKPIVGLFSFFVARAFVNDMIWVGSSQSATQHILNVASEFFRVNDISINTDKTVVIPINCKVGSSFLVISGSPIAIVKKRKSHRYLGIFFSTEGFLKPNLAKAQLDIQFFFNLVLRKTISNKQFLYLVLAVLHPVHWKKLDPCGLVPEWFGLSVTFLSSVASCLPGSSFLGGVGKPLNILEFQEFKLVCDQLFCISTGNLSVYMDGSLRDLNTIWKKTGAAVFFDNIGLGLGMRVTGLLFFTLVELQAIVLVLECVPFLSSIHLHSNSQAALDACKSELCFICLDFHVWCWVEHQHIVDIVTDDYLGSQIK
ncbi:hypothetical protein G9A89_022773 [Geosiphon pyriformis]|nr:hypothetical protein G9A89_022773 [Geosiphon pyriformis]